MSSWKHAGTCASLKDPLGIHIFAKGAVMVVLSYHWGYVMVSSSEFKGWNILCTIEFWEDVPRFGDGTNKLLGDFVQGCLVKDEVFSTIAFRYDNDGSWPAGVITAYDFCI